MAYDAGPGPGTEHLKERAKEVWRVSEQLFERQRQFLPLWQALAEIFYPERADFTMQQSDAKERFDGIYDGEPQVMRRDLANAIGSMLRPRNREWFFGRAAQEDLNEIDEVKRWCEEQTRRTRNILYWPQANFTSAMSEGDNDYVCFGNHVLRYTENRNRTGLLFTTAHLRDCAWDVNDEQVVDTLCERSRLSLRQIIQMFGLEALPKRLRDIHDKEPFLKLWIRRCVAPVEMEAYGKGQRPPRDMQFSSFYILEEDCWPLGEGWFRVFPYLVRRWMTVSGEVYARSPVTGVALADARTLNVAQASILKSVEWAVDGPKIARDDAIIGEIKLGAGEITYVSSDWDERMGAPLQTLQAGEPRLGHELVDRKHEFMGKAFMLNLLRRLPEKEMTAYEAGEWVEQYVQEASPVFEPMEAENARLMDGVFERAMFRGAYDPPPEELQGQELKFEFETPISQALKKVRAQQARQLRASMAEMAQLDPAAIDHVDSDAMFRDEVEGLGVAKWMRPIQRVMELRQQRAAMQQEQQQKQDMTQMADLAVRAKPETLAMLQQALQGAAGQAPEAPPPDAFAPPMDEAMA